MGLEISGLDEIVEQLEKRGQRGERAVNKALKIGGQVIVNQAIQEVPVGTHDTHLRDTIKVSNVRHDDGGTKYVVIKQGNRKAFYGHIVEEKTPFMQKALKSKGDKAIEVVSEIILKEMGIK